MMKCKQLVGSYSCKATLPPEHTQPVTLSVYWLSVKLEV